MATNDAMSLAATNDATSPGPTRQQPPPLPQSKQQVQARREALRAALVELEDVLTSPAGDRHPWINRVEAGIRRMQETLEAHVHDTEAEGGMLAQIDEDAPWLVGRVKQLRNEHGTLLDDTRALLEHCGQGHADQIRDDALELLRDISRHRQRGTDLLWDAYMVDLTAAD